MQHLLDELRENNGTISRTEEIISPTDEGLNRLEPLSSSSLIRQRPDTLPDINPRSNKRVLHEYPQTPTHGLVHSLPTPPEDEPYTITGMLNSYSRYPAIMQIPTMCETFDVLPSNVQTYVLWQLLRRCQIPTLQFAAEVIAPTLQRDFPADFKESMSGGNGK